MADVLWTGEPAVILISVRFATALENARISGWSTYPVHFDEQSIAEYVGLSITGRCGSPDYTRCERVRKDDEPGWFFRGFFFNEDSWDGSDVFLPRGTLFVLITERVRDLFRTQGTANIRCERLSDVLTPDIVVES